MTPCGHLIEGDTGKQNTWPNYKIGDCNYELGRNRSHRETIGAIYARFLNTVESWCHQVRKTYPSSEKDEAIHNLKENIRFFCDNPGFRELWSELREEFSGEMISLVDDCLK